MDRPALLISFLGFPGSGKTYFAKQLANELPAVLLNSDALRVAMFGSVDKIEHIRQTNPARLYSEVFGAMNYSARQILATGRSVIFDAQSSKRRDRQANHQLASSVGAIDVLVWIQTDRAEAISRGQQRQAASDSHRYTRDKMEYLVGRFDRVTQLPTTDENVIEISGEIPFTDQYQAFMTSLEVIYEKADGTR